MLNDSDFTRIADSLPFLQRADAALVSEFRRAAFRMNIPAGHQVFAQGDRAEALALLLAGVVRVFKIGETGREITLYRFGLGQSCILTANAILNQHAFPAIAMVEQDADAVMIPADVFRDWVRRHDLWREFVFELLSRRLMSVMAIVEQVAFRRMDARVADLLLQLAPVDDRVRITHQEIADELGSSREVISRILEDFSAQGLIRMARGAIEIVDRERVAKRAVV